MLRTRPAGPLAAALVRLGLTALVAALSAERSGATLDRPSAWGDDLLVRFTDAAEENAGVDE